VCRKAKRLCQISRAAPLVQSRPQRRQANAAGNNDHVTANGFSDGPECSEWSADAKRFAAFQFTHAFGDRTNSARGVY
jgi:hypothetical protein